jgi:hypothetical protein
MQESVPGRELRIIASLSRPIGGIRLFIEKDHSERRIRTKTPLGADSEGQKNACYESA